MKRVVVAFALGFGLMVSAPVSAQEPPAASVQEDPLFQSLFPPELIMQHRRAIKSAGSSRSCRAVS
jgi:hypothetical protein